MEINDLRSHFIYFQKDLIFTVKQMIKEHNTDMDGE